MLRSKERRDQIRFIGGEARAIFTDVRLYGRNGLRAVPRIIWLRDKEKNGTAWTCPPTCLAEASAKAEVFAKAEAVPP